MRKTRLLEMERRKYRELLDGVPGVLLLLDAEGVIADLNEGARDAFANAREDLLGQDILEFVHPDDAHRAREAMARARDGVSCRAPMRLRKRGGRYVHLALEWRPDAQAGAAFRIQVIGADTARSADADPLLALKAHLLDGSRAAAAAVEPGGRIRYANDAFAALAGARDEDLRGRELAEFVAADDEPSVHAMLRDARDAHSGMITASLPRPDGRVLSVELRATHLPGDNGEGDLYLVGARDMTDRLRDRDQIRVLADRLDIVTERTGDLIVERRLGASASIAFHTPCAEPMTGFDARDLEGDGRAFLRRVHAEDQRRYLEALSNADADDGGEYEVQYRFVRQDGQLAYFRERGVCRHDLDTGARRLFSSVRDVTEAAMASLEREQMRKQLLQAQKMESLGALAGGITHDFNNLLTESSAIKNSRRRTSPTRAGSTSTTPGRRRSGRPISSRSCSRFSRQGHGEITAIDPVPIVMETTKMLRETIDRRIGVQCHAPLDIWQIRADAGQVHQIVMNLCVNARDAIEAAMNGEHDTRQITVKLENVDLAEDEAGPAGRAGRFVRLTVADNGSGMDERTLGQIFEPFFTTKEEGRGTGLGLSTVRAIVKDHDGWIDIDSVVGRGTSFQVYLPRYEGELLALRDHEETHEVRGGTGNDSSGG
ncbi:MAG: PAS domain S-box protein [Deltaproteobacteria bacterium]|nr:PAS domain S-box protein [Deltaproteobacteria bacterium]